MLNNHAFLLKIIRKTSISLNKFRTAFGCSGIFTEGAPQGAVARASILPLANLLKRGGLELSRWWKDLAHTVQHFAKAPQQIGAIAPSSRFLATKMMDCIDKKKTKTVVELGAGTGAITQTMLRHVGEEARIIIIDLNAEAVNLLRERLKTNRNVEVVLDDAGNLPGILAQRGLARVDAIVSSLPYASMSPDVTRNILESAAQILSSEGHFVAFQYTPFLKKTFSDYFNISSVRFELRNLPPAIIYDCTSKGRAKEVPETQRSAS
ncbi:MAG: class I SAM-dependent methyltransferase [Silvanigrellaceae bacterium]